jgi:diguanylate cyclase (GGDEF)-like protein
MSAVQEAIGQRERGLRRLFKRPWCWPLLAMPTSLIVYVVTMLGFDLGLTGWEISDTSLHVSDITLFAGLLVAAVLCVEAMRRLGQPPGVSRDLLSAWWLPIALLLPPAYALVAPFVVGAVLYAQGRQTPVYRRAFSSAALGLAGAAASTTFHQLIPGIALATLHGSYAWLSRPAAIPVTLGCAILFDIVNTSLVAVAAHLADPEEPLGKAFWDRETLLLDLTETCVGILVTITCALSFLLLPIALPPVILLQRSLMHQQLQAAARTDPKTGLLNATAWQREAEAAIARALHMETPLALLLVDVDHFKQVNDGYGHLIGDEVLRGLAAELRHQVRESDVVGRFGGEEFTVLLPGIGATEACRIAERLRHSASVLKVSAEDAQISVTVSIGVAVLGRHGRDLFELLAAADLALYRAKDAGRNRIRLCAPVKGPRAPALGPALGSVPGPVAGTPAGEEAQETRQESQEEARQEAREG